MEDSECCGLPELTFQSSENKVLSHSTYVFCIHSEKIVGSSHKQLMYEFPLRAQITTRAFRFLSSKSLVWIFFHSCISEPYHDHKREIQLNSWLQGRRTQGAPSVAERIMCWLKEPPEQDCNIKHLQKLIMKLKWVPCMPHYTQHK